MIKVDEMLCSSCGTCASACPQLALSLVNRRLQVEDKRCNGCEDLGSMEQKLCIQACPNHALSWVEDRVGSNAITIVTDDKLPVDLGDGQKFHENEQQLERQQAGVMPALQAVLKQVGKDLIEGLPIILAESAEVFSDRGRKRCISSGRRQQLRRRRCKYR